MFVYIDEEIHKKFTLKEDSELWSILVLMAQLQSVVFLLFYVVKYIYGKNRVQLKTFLYHVFLKG